jgi:beta-lactamase class A
MWRATVSWAAVAVVFCCCGVGGVLASTVPATPAGEQLDWVVAELNSGEAPSAAAIEQHFAPAFLRAVSVAQLAQALGPVAAGRPLRVTSVLLQQGPYALAVRLESASGAAYRVSIEVATASPHLIIGLFFQPLAAHQAGTWRGVDRSLERLAGHASLYAGRAGGEAIHLLRAGRVGPIGSAFKLYVLGALADAVAAGRARWGEQLAIHDAWKSLPSGTMQNEPAGTRFTLRHYAEQMISISDNTAADHLINRLGRTAVERELTSLHNGAAGRNEPFLTTRELFALKLTAPAALRAAFIRADTATRRALLPRIDALGLPKLAAASAWTAPREIEQLEWFASPTDLARAIATLVQRSRKPTLAPLRSILSRNPGAALDSSTWPYVAFKGGSEPGVISLTWYLQRRDGKAFVLSIILDDTHDAIDTAAAVSSALSAIALLAHA